MRVEVLVQRYAHMLRKMGGDTRATHYGKMHRDVTKRDFCGKRKR